MAILKLYGAKIAMCTRSTSCLGNTRPPPPPKYLKNQPFGQIPYIDDDSFILYETCAVCRYIAVKYWKRSLIPTESKANTVFEQAALVELTNFDPSTSFIAIELFKRTYLGAVPDQVLVDTQLEILNKLNVYNVILSKQHYLAGDHLTLVDLFHIPYTPMIGAGGTDILTQKANVARRL
ncbi:hypothetical protein B0H14DRAFT_3469804 [Mycena olivaceomarginata]|nr:hypothetical protein B0H14DRAFT_3469804 [Mycena olivaceomarginata]